MGNETELDMSGKMNGAGDAVMLAAEVIDNRAMSKLILRKNGLCTKAAGEALGNMLQAKSSLKQLDISDNHGTTLCHEMDVAGFAQGISRGLSGNGALIKLNISNNDIGAEQKGGLQRICLASSIELAM
jgi:hypothetical protein